MFSKIVKFALCALALVAPVFAQYRFVGELNDYPIDCTFPNNQSNTVAGTVVALVSTPDIDAGAYRVVRLDTTNETAVIYLLNNNIYDNIFGGIFTSDPVQNHVATFTFVGEHKHMIVYSSIVGGLISNVTVPDATMINYDTTKSTLYGLTPGDEGVMFGQVSLNTGNFTSLLNTTMQNHVSIQNTIDSINHLYAFVGVVDNSAYDNKTLVVINMTSNSILSTVSFNYTNFVLIALVNDTLYMYNANDTYVGDNTAFAYLTMNIYTGESIYVMDAPNIIGLYTMVRGVDVVKNVFVGVTNDQNRVDTVNLTTGVIVNSSVLPNNSLIQAVSIVQNCVCCEQTAAQSRRVLNLLSTKMHSNNTVYAKKAVRFEKCDKPKQTSDAHHLIMSISLSTIIVAVGIIAGAILL